VLDFLPKTCRAPGKLLATFEEAVDSRFHLLQKKARVSEQELCAVARRLGH